MVFVLWSRLKRRRKWTFLDQGYLRFSGWPLTFLFVSGSFVFSETEYMVLTDSLRLLLKLIFIDVA